MSLQMVVGKFTERCNQGKHFEVMRTMHAPEMVSVEGDGKETVGKEAAIPRSAVFQGSNAIQGQDLRGPFFCGDAEANSGRIAVYSRGRVRRRPRPLSRGKQPPPTSRAWNGSATPRKSP